MLQIEFFLPKWVETPTVSFMFTKSFFLLYQTKQPNHLIVYLTSSPDNKEWFMKDNGVWLPLQMIIKEMLDKLQNAAMNDNKLYK